MRAVQCARGADSVELGEGMTLQRSLMTSKRDSWNTPECVLELVRKMGPIRLDPCSNADSVVGATLAFESGGLDIDWTDTADGGLTFVNPVYGREIWDWVLRCAFEAGRGCEIVALLPARPDTRWFSSAWEADALCFWRGRIRFLGAPSSAPFPSVVAYWGPRRYRFADVFSEVGHVVFP